MFKLLTCTLTFQLTLSQRNGYDATGKWSEWWDKFAFDDIYAHMVKITALSEYTQVNNGFVEVEFYGMKTGDFEIFHMVTHVVLPIPDFSPFIHISHNLG